MTFQLQHSIQILERTPQVLKTLLQNLSSDWTQHNEGGETWSPYDVIGHLIHGEKTDWILRSAIILSDKEDKSFEVFDRFAQFEASKGKTLAQLLEEFEQLRAENIKTLKSWDLQEADFEKEGIHPEFGKVNLKQMLATWTAHDLGHILQISRVMAKQYTTEVGPWKQYLRVLD